MKKLLLLIVVLLGMVSMTMAQTRRPAHHPVKHRRHVVHHRVVHHHVVHHRAAVHH